jgi:hypothetical protein
MLAAAANASSVDISDLAAAMKMSGAVFASNKQPMDDMVTALAMLGNAGLKGSDAGTSLKTMLLSLAAPTAKAKGVLADMGVAVYDASGNMRSFETIIADLSVATAGMTDAQRNAALSTVFGSDAIRAATILTRDYSTSWDGIAGALNNGSAASDVANARMKGVGGAIEYLKGSIDSFLIGAALPYMAVIGEIIRSGADMLTAFGALPQPVMDAAVAFGAVLAAAGPVMLAITGITAALGFLLSPIGLVVVGVGLPRQAWGEGIADGVREKVMEAVRVLESLGATVSEVDLPYAQESLAVYYVLMPCEVSANLSRFDGMRYGLRHDHLPLLETYARSRATGLGPEVRRRILLGTYALSRGYYDAYYLQAKRVQTLIRQGYEAAFRSVDLLLTPTAPTTAFKIGEKLSDPLAMYLEDVFTVGANVAGLPALSVPCGSSDGLPVGMHLLSRHFDEATLLAAARAYETVTAEVR